MSWMPAAKFVAYGTCVFLIPFCAAAYLVPLSSLSLGSIGLEPAQSDTLTGLSNIRGSIGGLRLGIIAMAALGTYYQRRDLCLGAAIVVSAVAAGRFVSLGLDGWNLMSFVTAASEVVITVALLRVGGFLGGGSRTS